MGSQQGHRLNICLIATAASSGKHKGHVVGFFGNVRAAFLCVTKSRSLLPFFHCGFDFFFSSICLLLKIKSAAHR